MANRPEPGRHCVVLIAATLFCFAIGTARSDEPPKQLSEGNAGVACCALPSLSAIHVKWHEPSEQEIIQARVELSPAGLRVREMAHSAGMEILQNFETQQAWLIDRQRSIKHLLPLEAVPAEMALATPGAGSSFLGTEPCTDLKAEDKGAGRWRGRAVRAFQCLDDEANVYAIDFVDQEYGIVVYRRGTDGYIDELQGLEDRSFASGHFMSPESYRDVDRQEFFFGVPELRSYESIEKNGGDISAH